MSTEKYLERYSEAISDSANDQYLSAAKKFLEYSKGNLTGAAVRSYIAAMQNEQYAPGTIQWHYGVIRRLFRTNKVDWPLERKDSPTVPEGEVFAPAIPDRRVIQMIEACKKSNSLSSDHIMVMALSSVYGIRQIEAASIRPQDVMLDSGGGEILVRTAKRGRQRFHMIPPEIVPWISGIEDTGLLHLQARNGTANNSLFRKLFLQIEEEAGLRHIIETGWHSIRRILVRLLVDAGIPELTVTEFLRWKTGDGGAMIGQYYRAQVVDDDPSMRTGMGGRQSESDAKIFEDHPFIKHWGTKDVEEEI